MEKYINSDFADTYEAYSNKIFIGINHIAIPYINICLMPGNPITEKQCEIDYSYYIFRDVQAIEYRAKTGQLNFDFSEIKDDNNITEYVIIGGYKNIGAEVKIKFKESIFYALDNAKFCKFPDMFMPTDTPDYNQNLNTEDVKNFFLLKNLPKEIKEILGADIGSFIWSL